MPDRQHGGHFANHVGKLPEEPAEDTNSPRHPEVLRVTRTGAFHLADGTE